MGEENGSQPLWTTIAGYLISLTTVLLCLLLGAMITLSCLQIALRTFFDSGLLWVDPLLRYLVLWSGLLGAVLATSRGSHIAIDLAEYLISDKLKPLVQLICSIFSTLTAGALTWASILFIRDEFQFGGESLFSIPSWCWNFIFPCTFALIAVSYLFQSAGLAIGMFRKPQPETEGGA